MDLERLLENFDHHDPGFAEDPFAVYEALREHCPVAHTDAHDGFWVVSRYRDVAAIARDDDTFLSSKGITIPASPTVTIPIDLDPPEFFLFRKLLQPLFSPSAVARLEPAIRAIATELVDEVIEDGRCDIHDALAKPLPAMMTFRMLGFPPEVWRDYVDSMEAPPETEEERQAAMTGFSRFFNVINEIMEARRREPKEDIVSFLLGAEVEGRPLTQDEINGVINLILAGGLLTTTDAIGNALIYLERDREARRRLIEEPELMPSAIEEFLRYEAPVTALCRTTSRDTEIGGQKLRAGERVMMLWASANRDEGEFANPNEVILDRHPNRHVAFGVGIHRCLGSNFGRLEFRIALEEVLLRMPDYTIQLDEIRPSKDVGTTYGRLAIPMTFTPGPRED